MDFTDIHIEFYRKIFEVEKDGVDPLFYDLSASYFYLKHKTLETKWFEGEIRKCRRKAIWFLW